MQLTDAVSAIAPEVRQANYIYYGREGEIVPKNVTRVRIDSSVRAIKGNAFAVRRLQAIGGRNPQRYAGGDWGLRVLQMRYAERDRRTRRRQED